MQHKTRRLTDGLRAPSFYPSFNKHWMGSHIATTVATSALLLLLLLVCTCTAADGVKGTAPVYSSFECSSVGGADPRDVTARSCVFHNVCLESIDDGQATWSYFADPSKPQDVPLLDPSKDSGEIAAMGYRRGLHMRVDIVRDRSYRPRHIVDPARVTVAFCTPTNSYAHFVMDGMFGLHWLLTHYGYADEATGALTSRANVDILDVCRQSKQEKHLRGLFTDTTPSLGTRLSLFLLHCNPTLHICCCVLQITLGAATQTSSWGLQGTTRCTASRPQTPSTRPPKTLTASATSFLFAAHSLPTQPPSDRMALQQCTDATQTRYGAKKDPKEITKVVVSHRAQDHMLLNALDIVTALKKQHAEVELVQLDSLTLEETAAVLANAKVLVAVSSDDLVSMALLPKGSTVVSIVPFGNPDRVWRPLAKRFGINYVAWHNKDRSKARFHPELLSAYGVVGAEAEEIVNADHYDSERQNWAGEFYWAMVFVALFFLVHFTLPVFHCCVWNTGTRRLTSTQ